MYSGKDEGMMKKRVILAAVGAAMVMGLGGCGNSPAPTTSAAAAERAEGSVRIGNPFTEVSSVSEAEEMTGFSITVPEAPAEYPDTCVRVMLDSMIEVIFENKAKETADAIEEGYRIRKEAGAEDISGDYNEYAEASAVTVEGREVTMKGNDGTVSLAVWTADGYSYAVLAEEHPMTADEMSKIIAAIY